MPQNVTVKGTIRLDQFLKWTGIADTGGMAKNLIQSNRVKVNDSVETRRTRKLGHGDLVKVENYLYRVVIDN